MNKTFWKVKVVVVRERGSVAEHSTAGRKVGGSIPLVPCLKIVARVKQRVFFLENQKKNREIFNGKRNIIINCRDGAMNFEL